MIQCIKYRQARWKKSQQSSVFLFLPPCLIWCVVTYQWRHQSAATPWLLKLMESLLGGSNYKIMISFDTAHGDCSTRLLKDSSMITHQFHQPSRSHLIRTLQAHREHTNSHTATVKLNLWPSSFDEKVLNTAPPCASPWTGSSPGT